MIVIQHYLENENDKSLKFYINDFSYFEISALEVTVKKRFNLRL